MFRTMLFTATLASAFGTANAQTYSPVTLAYTGSVQQFSVGPAGLYFVQVLGAGGGGNTSRGDSGGFAASISAAIPLARGALLNVVVGGVGRPAAGAGAGGGGGGTFILGAGGAPLAVAGGGGGGGAVFWLDGGVPRFSFQNGFSASLGTSGKDGGANYAGAGGTGGSGGNAGFQGGAGGAGVFGNGGNSFGNISNLLSATGGQGRSGNFAGGLPARHPQGRILGGAGGFGGGGGSGYHPNGGPNDYISGGGGGGGYSGGGAGGFAGGGGGSFVTAAGNLRESGLNTVVSDGYARIQLERVFAQGRVLANSLDFGTVRGGSAAVFRGLEVQNIPGSDLSGIVFPTTDTLLYNVGALPPQVTGLISSGVLGSPGQQGIILLKMSTDRPGDVAGDIAINFASQSSDLRSTYAVEGGSVSVTGLVTEVARAGFSAISGATVTFTNGSYLVDYGDVALESSNVARLSFANLIGASAYAETLGFGLVRPAFDRYGLNFNGNVNFEGELGGGQAFDFVYGFETTGLSAGLYTSEGVFFSTSRFPGLDDTPGTFTPVFFRANILAAAAVPEPATWGLMIAGFGMVGATLRRRAAQAARMG